MFSSTSFSFLQLRGCQSPSPRQLMLAQWVHEQRSHDDKDGSCELSSTVWTHLHPNWKTDLAATSAECPICQSSNQHGVLLWLLPSKSQAGGTWITYTCCGRHSTLPETKELSTGKVTLQYRLQEEQEELKRTWMGHSMYPPPHTIT